MSSGAGPILGATSATLYFGPWYRKSPFFEATLRWGCTAYDVYNHMYLPAYYDELAAVASGRRLAPCQQVFRTVPTAECLRRGQLAHQQT